MLLFFLEELNMYVFVVLDFIGQAFSVIGRVANLSTASLLLYLDML